MKLTKMYSGNYQRNGIQGQGFYSALINFKDGKYSGKGFLITFTADDSYEVNPNNCRVVDLNNLKQSWRGDSFAYSLREFFIRNNVTDVYSYLEKTK